MYSTKSIGPRMEPWGTPEVTGYSCEDFPSRTTQLSITEKRNKTEYLTWNSIKLMFVKKINMPNPVKSLGYIKCYSSSSPRSLKRPRNSDVTVRRSAVDREDLKPHGKSEKRPHYSRWSTILLFTSFSKT